MRLSMDTMGFLTSSHMIWYISNDLHSVEAAHDATGSHFILDSRIDAVSGIATAPRHVLHRRDTSWLWTCAKNSVQR